MIQLTNSSRQRQVSSNGQPEFVRLDAVKHFDVVRLPREVMATVGSAAQTFAVMRAYSEKSGMCWANLSDIAESACLPLPTVKHHVKKLVEAQLVKSYGREHRRTVSYEVNGSHHEPFGMLPRWAARLLQTWSERAVFALVVSRDSLNESISRGTAYGSDVYSRLHYPVCALATDSGLSPRVISIAKTRLVKQGLLTVDPATWWRDDLGQCKAWAHKLYLNPDFQVPDVLVHRCAKMIREGRKNDPPTNRSRSMNRSIEYKFETNRLTADYAFQNKENTSYPVEVQYDPTDIPF